MLSDIHCVTDTVTNVTEPFDARYVIACLEEAGRTEIAMRHHGFTPGLRLGGLDYVRDFNESYGWEKEPLKPPVPSAIAISRMDRTLAWISHIPKERVVYRRVVRLRSLIHPISERYVFPWRLLSRKLGIDRDALKRYHGLGIDLIVAGMTQPK